MLHLCSAQALTKHALLHNYIGISDFASALLQEDQEVVMEGMSCNKKRKRTQGRSNWNAQRKHKYTVRLNQKKKAAYAAWKLPQHKTAGQEIGTTEEPSLDISVCEGILVAARGLAQCNGNAESFEDKQLNCPAVQLGSDMQIDILTDSADVLQKQSGYDRSDAQEEDDCHNADFQTLSGYQMSDCEVEEGCQDAEIQIQSGYSMPVLVEEDTTQTAADTDDLGSDEAYSQPLSDPCAAQSLTIPGGMSAVVSHSQKASPDLTPGEAAQAPACAETQAFMTANKLQAVDVQLSQSVADTSLSRHASSLPDHQTDSNLATDLHVTADASASAQQRESAKPKQAALVSPTESAGHDFPGFQPLVDGDALPLQSTAEASAASTPAAEPPRFALSVSPLHMSQEALFPGAPCEQTLQPAEPFQAASSQKASPHLAPGEVAQAHASAETSAAATTSQSHSVEKQLPQAPSGICLSKGVQNLSNLLDGQTDCSQIADCQAAIGACNNCLPQQDRADPAAASVASAGPAREDLLAVQAWIDQALSSQTGAQGIVTNPTCVDLLKLVQPASLPPVLQEDTCEQPLQPAESPQADRSQEASAELAPVETAQAFASAETQALATANKSQDAEQQLCIISC